MEALQAHNRMQATRIAALEAENTRLQGLEAEITRLQGLQAQVVRREVKPALPQARKTSTPSAAPPAPLPRPPQTVLPASSVLLDSLVLLDSSAAQPLNDEKPPAAPANDKSGLMNNKSGAMNVGLRRMELLLSDFHPFALTLPQLGALTHMDLSGASGQNAVRALRREGLAVWDGERLAATEKGRRTQVRPMDAQTCRRRWEQVLGGTASRLLWALEEAARDGVLSVTLSEWLDWAAYSKGGPITVAKARLVELSFAVSDGKRYRLGDWLREEDKGSEAAAAGPASYLRLDRA